jgi:hypothetical protein
MKWMRSLVPQVLLGAAISLSASGFTIAAQDENAKPEQPAPEAKATQNDAPQPDASETKTPAEQPDRAAPPERATTDRNAPQERPDRPPPKNAANRNRADQNNQAATERQRTAILGAKFDAAAQTGTAQAGITVTSVDQNGLLSQAGLRQNDRIVSADGRAFANPRQFEAYLWAQAGRSVPVIIERGGQRYTVQAAIPMHSMESGWLGVFLDEGDANDKGARVTQVYPSGPAARAGLQVGDVVRQINDQQISGSADAVMVIREFQPQAQIELLVARDDQELKIPVTLGSRGRFNYQSGYAGAQQDFLGQQQGQPGFGNDQQFGNDQFNGVPPHAMQLEHDRRVAEQHERIEEELRLLREEVKQLRELLEKK